MCTHHEAMLTDVEAFRKRLDADVASGAVSDDVLTTGYAHALELDAERASYDRTLDALLARGDDQGVLAVIHCRRALAHAGARLRDALASARPRREGAVRPHGRRPAAS